MLISFERFSNTVIKLSAILSSKELVGSSKINNFGFLKRALANIILCLSPPENLFPFSPTFDFILFSKVFILSIMPAWVSESITLFSISLFSLMPKATFEIIELSSNFIF